MPPRDGERDSPRCSIDSHTAVILPPHLLVMPPPLPATLVAPQVIVFCYVLPIYSPRFRLVCSAPPIDFVLTPPAPATTMPTASLLDAGYHTAACCHSPFSCTLQHRSFHLRRRWSLFLYRIIRSPRGYAADSFARTPRWKQQANMHAFWICIFDLNYPHLPGGSERLIFACTAPVSRRPAPTLRCLLGLHPQLPISRSL